MKLTAAFLAALTCAALPAFAIPVSVSVVGPDNQPLPGAKLSWFEVKSVRDDAGQTTEQPGANGVFAWNWDGDFADKRPLGEKRFLRVRVEAPGMAPQIQIVKQGQTTIALQKARSWGGVVLDEKQQPVAGATLKLGEVKPPDLPSEEFSTFLEVAPQTVVTDAQGRWTMVGLPARGTAFVSLIDPRFARTRVLLTIGESDAAPIFAKPGGAVTGQLLKPDGTPIVGETVESGFGVDNQTTTDAQGRFKLQDIESGDGAIIFGKSSDEEKRMLPTYVLERLRIAKVEAGKTADMGEIKARKGLLLRAIVIDADTKKPLTDARFRAGYNTVPSVMATDGTLQTRVLPSKGIGSFDRAKIESVGYVDYDLPLKALEAEGEFDLGTITMQRGTIIRGAVRMEGGDPKVSVVLPGISFSRDGKYDFVSVAGDGKFESKPHEAGSYSVNLNGRNGDWQIVSPRTVSVPAAGEEFVPIEIVVKRLTPILPQIKSARGRVLDENGRGVAGVNIRARMSGEGGGGYTNPTATTDADGAFTLNGNERIVGVEIESAEHPDYIVGGKTEVSVKEGIATISGLIAKKRGAIYTSHVLDAQGQPAQNAWVAVVEARDYEPVQTDENGKFDLLDVPLTQFTLVAAQGRDWARQTVRSEQAGAPLRLQTSVSEVNRERILKQLDSIKSGVQPDKLFAAWDVLGAEGIERYIRRRGEPSNDVMTLFGIELARRDPAQLLRRAPELLGNSTGEARENLEAQLNLVRAATGDAGQRTDAGAWLDEQQQIKREINPRSVTQLLQMAAVAQKLKRDDASQWTDYAAAVAAQIKGDPETNFYAWSNLLAALGSDSIALFAEGRDAPAEFKLWSNTARAMARAGDVAGARKALARMEVLLSDPAMTGAAEEARKRQRYLPAQELEEAQSSVAGALAASDPVAAFALAQKVTDVFVRVNAMIGVGKGAQKAGNADIAEKALRDVMKARIGNVEYFAQAASIGARVNPQLGAELFALAKEKALPKDERSSFSPSVGAWAFYHAPYDAAQSRVLIEREWEWRLPAAIVTKNDFSSNDMGALYELVHGMTAVDTKRAAEMQTQVDAIETKNYGKAMSQFDIAVAALASAEQREKLDVVDRS